MQYDFEVMHIPGGRNIRADCLSRFPSQISSTTDEMVDDECCMIATVEVDHVCVCSETEWKEKLAGDNDLCAVMRFIAEGWPYERDLTMAIQPFWKISDELTIEEGILLRNDKIIPPEELRSSIVNKAHEGHLGTTMTKRRIQDSFWCPRMDSEIEHLVKNCAICSNSDKSLKTATPPLMPIACPGGLW
ncbi:hypothetical protein NDU88_001794 [Pleurodeles waltl]|uniref:Gypsy retrotransposon integrase-like protein 1 n=1 Tax=Pleurodeles waltl TaxID=8319 RepID=A0AAV7VXI3_PLEWA|nr:hypothetical protein NDU88_001794 [Pleurodeles waltl]